MKIIRAVLIAIFALVGAVSDAVGEPAQGSFTVGMLSIAGAPSDHSPPAFIQALRELGYREGSNLTIVRRVPKSSNAELPALAAELVALKPDVLVTMTTPPSLALKNATTSIPIVALNVGDPVFSGLVQSLAHPGGNVTGTANAVEVWAAKRLQAIGEVLPGVRCVLYLRNHSIPTVLQTQASMDRLAQTFGFALRPIDAATGDELDRVFSTPLDESCKAALFMLPDGFFSTRRKQIAEFALRNKIALFAPFREDAEAGALTAFGVNTDDQFRLGAAYVDKILKGAKPADLPVQLPTKFEMVINLKTAKAIGVTIPQSILAQADQIIE